MLQAPALNLISPAPLPGHVARHGGAPASARAAWARTYTPRDGFAKPAAVEHPASVERGGPSRLDAQVFLNTLGADRFVSKYQAGETVFRQGDPADAVFYVQKGRVQIAVLSPQGKEGVVAVLGIGEFFGEGCLAGQPLHRATATAMGECTIVAVEKPAMVRLLRDEPIFSQIFMSFLLARNVQVEADLLNQLFNSSERRLARVLLQLADIDEDGTITTIPKISQEVLAARVGTTRSRINLFMNKFRKLGFIDYDNGPLKIRPSLLNVIVCD